MSGDFVRAQLATRADDFQSIQDVTDEIVRQGIDAEIVQEGQNYLIEIGGVRLTLSQARFYAKRLGDAPAE